MRAGALVRRGSRRATPCRDRGHRRWKRTPGLKASGAEGLAPGWSALRDASSVADVAVVRDEIQCFLLAWGGARAAYVLHYIGPQLGLAACGVCLHCRHWRAGGLEEFEDHPSVLL